MLRPDPQKLGQLLSNLHFPIQQNIGHLRRGRPVTALEGHGFGDHLQHRIGGRTIGTGLKIRQPPGQGQIVTELPEAQWSAAHAGLSPPQARLRTAPQRLRRSMLSAR